MDSKKVIAICQSGGDFVTSKDGCLSYEGGEAFAVDIDEKTKLSDFKSEVAEMFNCSADKMSVKYFLPGNKKTLITISKDKDLQRMISFVGDSMTVDVFILVEDAIVRNVSNTPVSRSSMTTVPGNVVPDMAPVDVPIAVVNGIDLMDVLSVSPVSCAPISNSTEKHMKSAQAQQWENLITGVGQRFNSLAEVRDALHKFAIARGFSYRYKKNDSNRVSARCKYQGCPWHVYASRLSTTQFICIKKMNPTHTCEVTYADVGYRATKGWIGNIIKEKLKASPHCRTKDIVEDIKKEYGVQLSHSQVWRAKEFAREQLQGSYKEAYSLLPFFCEKIKETNLGSIATFSTKEDSTFHRLFVSFHASILGFDRGCRPLIFLDSTHLNSKYQGTLMAAVSVDADDGIFPVAFAVVDAETDDNWYWFLVQLKSAISTSTSREITFVADFQNGLKESLVDVFGTCYHSYCLRRLAEKLNKELNMQFSHEARRFMINDFYAAASAPKLDGFQKYVENIKGISLEAYNWIVQSEPEHWANAFFGGARYNYMNSMFGQDFYGWAAEAHELPITQLIDALRGKMMEVIYLRRVESDKWLTILTPANEEKLKTESEAAKSFQVLLSHGNTFEVRGESVDVVDIENWDCSCRVWQLSGLPCRHALAVFECTGRNPYDYCSRYLTTEFYRLTYAESIHPVPNVERPVESESGEEGVIIVTPPPAAKRVAGRPKTKPEPSSLDFIRRQLQCSKCKGLGHNKRKCPLP